jgi:alpha-amylase
LRTGSSSVQQKIAAYLVELSRSGVAGYRIDAAKHIQPVELDSIVSRVNRTLVGEGLPRPYLFLEVIDHGGEGVSRRDYYGLGYVSGGGADISEFKAVGINDKFLGVAGQKVSELATFGEGSWGLMPSAKGVIFLQNHDTQRVGGLRWSDGDRARIANVFLLAQPYGYPMVMSGYAFDRASPAGRDTGPPPGGGGGEGGQLCVPDPATAPHGTWACEHRDGWLRQMMRFRRAVTGLPQMQTWNDGGQGLAFSRGTRGFVALNNGGSTMTATIPTALAPGRYCDLLTGGLINGACAGTTYTIAADGSLSVTLAPVSALVLLVGENPS